MGQVRLTTYVAQTLALLVSIFALLLPITNVVAQPTPHINYQGKLTDATGAAVTHGS